MNEFNPTENDENLFADAGEYEERQEVAREIAEEAGKELVREEARRAWGTPSERNELLSMISDAGKDAMGFRPRWHGGENLAELRAVLEGYYEEIRWQIAQEAKAAREEAEATEKAMTRKEWTLGTFWDALSQANFSN